eukprot:373309-Prorocentrum_minimum.AAC.1
MTSYPKPNSPKDIQTSYPSKTASSCTVDNEHYSTAPSTIVGKLVRQDSLVLPKFLTILHPPQVRVAYPLSVFS